MSVADHTSWHRRAVQRSRQAMHDKDAIAIASAVGKLLALARHIKETPGYKTPGRHSSRSAYGFYVRSLATRIRKRHRLNLTLIDELLEAERILCPRSKS